MPNLIPRIEMARLIYQAAHHLPDPPPATHPAVVRLATRPRAALERAFHLARMALDEQAWRRAILDVPEPPAPIGEDLCEHVAAIAPRPAYSPSHADAADKASREALLREHRPNAALAEVLAR